MGSSHSRFASATQDGGASTTSLHKALAYVAGGVFTLASAATNLTYAIAKADALAPQIIWGAVAVAASLALALAPSAFVASLGARRFGAAILSALAALIFGVYSITAALGSATGGRLVADAEASDTANKRRDATFKLEAVTRELGKLPTARTIAELDAVIDREMASRRDLNDCVGWLPATAARAVCVSVSELKAERGRAERRAVLEAEATEARDALAALPARKTVANADAMALQGFAAAMGVTATVDTINRWLVILAVLVIEFGGGLAFAIGASAGRITAAVQPLPPQPVHAPTVDLPAITGDQHALTEREKITPDQQVASDFATDHSPRDRLIAALHGNQGVITTSQREIGRLVGLSQSRVNGLLRDLATAGVIRVRAGSTGTTIRLEGSRA